MEEAHSHTQNDRAQDTIKLLDHTRLLCKICEGILLRAGPYLKENTYQDLLIHELNKLDIKTSREMVFGMTFKDSDNNDVATCNSQFLRSDIELIQLGGIIELKSTTAATKDDQMWQLRNYLEQRDDRYWGVVINFIHKFGTRTSPKIQCDLLFKKNAFHQMSWNNETIQIRQYYKWSVESDRYPDQGDIIIET